MAKAIGMTHAPPLPERRIGADRRRRDAGPPGGWERRRNVEPRKPEVTELEFTPSQWDALQGDAGEDGSGPPPSAR